MCQELEQKFRLITTTSRTSLSIADQFYSIDSRINDLCAKKSSNDISIENQMDTSDINFVLPWKNLDECEQLIKYLVDKTMDSNKRRQLFIQLQWLINSSDQYHDQLCQTILKCCSNEEFLNNLKQQLNSSFVLFGILIKKKRIFNENFIQIIHRLETNDHNLFQMKIKQLKHNLEISKRIDQQNEITLTIEHMFNILSSYSSLSDGRIEKQFYQYFELNKQYEHECKHILMNTLVEIEYKLSEPTIGMILDQLEKLDYKSSR